MLFGLGLITCGLALLFGAAVSLRRSLRRQRASGRRVRASALLAETVRVRVVPRRRSAPPPASPADPGRYGQNQRRPGPNRSDGPRRVPMPPPPAPMIAPNRRPVRNAAVDEPTSVQHVVPGTPQTYRSQAAARH
jgi:hypothetical protein